MITTQWRKSSRSGGSGNCVEAREHEGWIQVRDSKNPVAGALTFKPEAFAEFVERIKSGDLDGPTT